MSSEQHELGAQADLGRHCDPATYCVALGKSLCVSEPRFLIDQMGLMVTAHAPGHWDHTHQVLSPVSGQK